MRCLLVTSFTFSRFCFTTVCSFVSSITLNNLWADFCEIWGVSSLWTREELIKFWKLEGRIMVNDNGWHSGGGMRCTECRPVDADLVAGASETLNSGHSLHHLSGLYGHPSSYRV